MSVINPTVNYPEGDSPENSIFIAPETPASEYLKTVIPVYRKGEEIYALFPESVYQSDRVTAYMSGHPISGSLSALYDGRWTDHTGGVNSQTFFDYPGWGLAPSSPFGNAPGNADITTQSVIDSLEYGEWIIYQPDYMPGYTLYLFNLEVSPTGGSGETVTWFRVSQTITTWAIYTQRIDQYDEMVILTPILAALGAPLLLSLFASVGNNTQQNDIRRKRR